MGNINEFENPYLPLPDEPGPSEIIMGGLGYDPGSLHVNNWIDHGPEDYRFINKRRGGLVTEVIVHETVTCNQMATLRVLKPPDKSNPGGRDLGVHFILESNGTVYQNADVLDDLTWHAGQHNGPSVGIEVVNPYEPRFMKSGSPWTQVIAAPWAAGGKYVVPTRESAEALKTLLEFLTTPGRDSPGRLEIPRTWIGLHNGRMALARVPGAERMKPGIYSHMYFEHADGSWLVLYAWLRIVAELSAEEAYAEAVRRATGASSAGGADVSDLLPPAAA